MIKKRRLKPEERAEVGKRIRELRGQLNLTLEEFGLLFGGASKAGVYNWENGKSLPNEKYLTVMAHMLKVSLEVFLCTTPFKQGELVQVTEKAPVNLRKIIGTVVEDAESDSVSIYVKGEHEASVVTVSNKLVVRLNVTAPIPIHIVKSF